MHSIQNISEASFETSYETLNGKEYWALLLIILDVCNFGLEGLRHRHLWPTVVWWSDLVIITTILVCWDYKKVFHYAKLCQCFPISINVKPAEKLTRTSEQPLPSKKFYFLMHRDISRVGGRDMLCPQPTRLWGCYVLLLGKKDTAICMIVIMCISHACRPSKQILPQLTRASRDLLCCCILYTTAIHNGVKYYFKNVPNHVKLGVSPRILYCVVDTGYGVGGSLVNCRPALPKGFKVPNG